MYIDIIQEFAFVIECILNAQAPTADLFDENFVKRMWQ